MLAIVGAFALMNRTLEPPGLPEVRSLRDQLTILSRELGKSVTASEGLGRCPIYVRQASASSSELLEGLAKAVHASVFRTGDGYLIQRTREDLDSLQSIRARERFTWLQSTVDRHSRYREAHEKGADLGKAFLAEIDKRNHAIRDYSRGTTTKIPIEFPEELLPSSELLESLCKRIGFEKLATIPSGEIQVFEDQPTVGAKPLPESSDLREKYVRAMSGLAPLDLNKTQTSEIGLGGSIEQEAVKEWLQIDHSVERLRLEIRAEEDLIVVSLEGYNRTGNRTLMNSLLAERKGQIRASKALLIEDSAAGIQHGDGDIVTVPDRDLVPLKLNTVGLTPDERDWLVHPETNEPLNRFPRLALEALSREHPSGFFIGVVPDELWVLTAKAISAGKLHVPVLRELLDECEPSEILQTPGGTIYRPIDAEYVEKAVADRKVLGKFARKAIKDNSVSLRNVAVLYHESAEYVGPLTEVWANRIASKYSTDSDNILNAPIAWLTMLGAISDQDWDSLESGQRLSVGTLGVTKQFQRLASAPFLSVVSERPFPDAFLHAVELFRQAALEETPLSLAVASTPVVHCWFSGEKEPLSWRPIEHLNAFTNLVQPWEIEWEGDKPVVLKDRSEYDKLVDRISFRRGVESNLVFVLALPAGLKLMLQHKIGVKVEPDAGSFQGLSQSDRDELWERARKMGISASFLARKARQDARTGSGD